MLDVAQAFHEALQNQIIKGYRVEYWSDTSFEFLDKVRNAMQATVRQAFNNSLKEFIDSAQNSQMTKHTIKIE